MTTEHRFMSRTLRELLAAGDTVVALVTPEDGRGREAVADALQGIPHRTSTWNCVDGVERQDDGTPPPKGLEGPDAILAHIRKAAPEDMRQQLADVKKAKAAGTDVPPMRVVVWTLAGMQHFMSSARVRTLLLLLHTELRETMTRVVLLGPEHGLDKGLEKVIDVVRLPLPEREEVTGIARGALRSLEIDDEPSDEAVDALMGLTKVQADLALRRSLVFHDRPHAPSMLRAKADIFRDQGILDMTTPGTTLDDVGGQDELCAWVRARRRSFTPDGVRFVGRTPKGVLLVGVPGCLAGETPIHDPVDGTTHTVRERWEAGEAFHVWALNHHGVPVVTAACPPERYPPERMLRLELEDGSAFRVTAGHRFWNGRSWMTADEAFERHQTSGRVPLASSSESVLSVHAGDGLHWSETAEGSLVDCRSGCRCGGGQPPPDAKDARSTRTSPAGVPGRSPSPERSDARVGAPAHSLEDRRACRRSMPRSDGGPSALTRTGRPAHPRPPGATARPRGCMTTSDDQPPPGGSAAPRRKAVWRPGDASPSIPAGDDANPAGDDSCGSSPSTPQSGRRGSEPRQGHPRTRSSAIGLPWATACEGAPHGPLGNSTSNIHEDDNIVNIAMIVPSRRKEPYFDFHVPLYNNYWACGTWHHNSGKTMAADAIAGTFGVPKLRLDMGKVFHHLVGSSEGRIRDALEIAERVAPAVLHVDEIEKAVAGTGGGGDSGVATRVFGTFIQWLSDKTAPVFVVATANDVMGVPPELLRKGRFDDMFFVDLPSAEERADILRIHVARRHAAGCGVGEPDGYDLDALAAEAEGFVGSELEQVVVDALVDAFDEGAPLATQEHMARAIRQTTPLSATRAESVEALRAWAKDRARFASSAAAARAGSKVLADVSVRVAALERAGVVRLAKGGGMN